MEHGMFASPELLCEAGANCGSRYPSEDTSPSQSGFCYSPCVGTRLLRAQGTATPASQTTDDFFNSPSVCLPTPTTEVPSNPQDTATPASQTTDDFFNSPSVCLPTPTTEVPSNDIHRTVWSLKGQHAHLAGSGDIILIGNDVVTVRSIDAKGEVDCGLRKNGADRGTTISQQAVTELAQWGTVCATCTFLEVAVSIKGLYVHIPCRVVNDNACTLGLCDYGVQFLRRHGITIQEKNTDKAQNKPQGRTTRAQITESLLSTESCAEVLLMKDCCDSESCLDLSSIRTVKARLDHIKALRSHHSKMADKTISKWLFCQLQMCVVRAPDNTIRKYDTRVNRIPCCNRKFKMLYGITATMWNNVTKDIEDGCQRVRSVAERDARCQSISSVHHRQLGGRHVPGMRVRAFIVRDLLSMSEKADPVTGKRMCVRPDPERVYQSYVALHGATHTFDHIKAQVKETMRQLKGKGWQFRKQHQFTKCDTCVQNDERLLNATQPAERAQILRDMTAHYDFTNGEKDGYYLRWEEAIYQKEHILSTIMDGEDQSCTDTPHYAGGKTKSLNCTVSTKVFGIRYHGHGVCFYVTCGHCPVGSSYNIHALNDSLRKMQAQYKRKEISFPCVWYLQIDGASDNKNRYLFAYIAWLVERGVFDRVQCHFLAVGHTHEDIDQLFSVISKALKKQDVLTIDRLCELIAGLFPTEGHVTAEVLWGIHDYKAWFVGDHDKGSEAHTKREKNHTEDYVCHKMEQIRQYHEFRFTTVMHGDVRRCEMRAKKWWQTPDNALKTDGGWTPGLNEDGCLVCTQSDGRPVCADASPQSWVAFHPEWSKSGGEPTRMAKRVENTFAPAQTEKWSRTDIEWWTTWASCAPIQAGDVPFQKAQWPQPHAELRVARAAPSRSTQGTYAGSNAVEKPFKFKKTKHVAASTKRLESVGCAQRASLADPMLVHALPDGGDDSSSDDGTGAGGAPTEMLDRCWTQPWTGQTIETKFCPHPAARARAKGVEVPTFELGTSRVAMRFEPNGGFEAGWYLGIVTEVSSSRVYKANNHVVEFECGTTEGVALYKHSHGTQRTWVQVPHGETGGNVVGVITSNPGDTTNAQELATTPRLLAQEVTMSSVLCMDNSSAGQLIKKGHFVSYVMGTVGVGVGGQHAVNVNTAAWPFRVGVIMGGGKQFAGLMTISGFKENAIKVRPCEPSVQPTGSQDVVVLEACRESTMWLEQKKAKAVVVPTTWVLHVWEHMDTCEQNTTAACHNKDGHILPQQALTETMKAKASMAHLLQVGNWRELLHQDVSNGQHQGRVVNITDNAIDTHHFTVQWDNGDIQECTQAQLNSMLTSHECADL